MPHRAGFWIRVLATTIDVVAMLLMAGAAAVAVEAVLANTSYVLHEDGHAAIVYGLWLAYTSMEVWFAATPGKLVFRLRVTNADCTDADFWRLFLRWSTKWSALFLGFFFLLTGWPPLYLLAGFINTIVLIGCFFAANEDRLTWHDQWAHTAVCRVPRRERASGAMMPVPPPLPPAQPPSNA